MAADCGSCVRTTPWQQIREPDQERASLQIRTENHAARAPCSEGRVFPRMSSAEGTDSQTLLRGDLEAAAMDFQ